MMDLSRKLFVTREKNFVKHNILRVKHSNPAEPKQRFVDTRYGNTNDLKSSGLLPIYVHKKVRVYHAYKKKFFSFALFLHNYFALFYHDTILRVTFFPQNYGRVPKFIAVDRKIDVSAETKTIKQRDFDGDEVLKIPSCRYIDKEERKILLDVGIDIQLGLSRLIWMNVII